MGPSIFTGLCTSQLSPSQHFHHLRKNLALITHISAFTPTPAPGDHWSMFCPGWHVPDISSTWGRTTRALLCLSSCTSYIVSKVHLCRSIAVSALPSFARPRASPSCGCTSVNPAAVGDPRPEVTTPASPPGQLLSVIKTALWFQPLESRLSL